MRRGYERSQRETAEMNLEAWRRTRLEIFVGAAPYMKNPNMTIYDFFKLPGDPTPAELKALHDEEAQKITNEMQAAVNDLVKRGYLVQNITVQA